ncbi:MAG: hypothetical protein QOJ35_338 [Solirubrobacteraceae bacterium]|nr:hypothetical protein [Solirubrobacteraceae bacterium]
MSDAGATPRPQTAFSASTDPAFDHESLRDLLVHPETPVEVTGPESRPRFAFARVGLVVATISGLCLVPAASLADSTSESTSASTPPPSCEVSGIKLDTATTPSTTGTTDDPACVENTDTTPPLAVTGGSDGSDGAQPSASPPPPPPAPAPAEATPPPPPPPPPAAAEPAASAASAATTSTPAPSHATPATGTPARAATSSTQSAVAKHDAPAEPAKRRIGAAAGQDWTAGERGTQRRGHRAHRARSKKAPHTTRGRHRTAPHVAAPVPALTAGVAQGSTSAPFFVTDEPVIPRFLIGLYKQAGHKYRIPWPILAAINEIETDFGRNVAVSSAGAIGWMQFMPATWRSWGVDADHDGVKDPNNPRDAIFAAARYLRAGGAPRNMRRAIFAYNHAGWYVDSVLLRAERIAQFQGERNRTLTRLLRAGERHVVRQVLDDPRITIYQCGREDIAAGRIDRRVLVVLRFLAWSGLHPTVTALECGHSTYTTAGNISAHSYGDAVDIAAINGIPIVGHQGPGSVTDATIRELLTLRGVMSPAQIISLMTFPGADNTLAMADHADHIHVGFRALPDPPR